MNKLLITIAAAVVFMVNGPVMAATSSGGGEDDNLDIDASSTAERALKGETAQNILNRIACLDKEPGDKVKDSTDGTTHTCPEVPEG
ncbi:MAG: hypothetical protein CMH70_01220 [Nitrosomonadaceae bacterium]|nr:hypothetical protein [Nitrosomonadaceae bacterium]|tara:strand:+ start:44 stop:304 length:261 start_codon:yes stop_codon:yes gene_type:complete